MQAFARMSIYSLLAGVLLATSGCVHGAYSQQDQRDRDADRDRDRHLAYERCREEGGRGCDDALQR